MNIKNQTVKALAKLMKETGLSSLEIKENDSYIKLEMGVTAIHMPVTAQAIPIVQENRVETVPPIKNDSPGMDFNDIKLVTSPMVGVYYAAPSPESEPFVKIGSRVREGDVLCIVEAMKLMNEITAEFGGEIVDICAVDGGVVEFGQTLFKII